MAEKLFKSYVERSIYIVYIHVITLILQSHLQMPITVLQILMAF